MVEEFFFEIERGLSPSDVRAFARIGAYDSLLSGVGLVWDHYYEAEQVALALQDVGLCGVVAPTLQDLAGPGVEACDAQLRCTVDLATDGKWASEGIFAALGPHATDTVSEALWQRAVSVAEQHRLPMHAHLAQSPEEFARCQERHGCSPTAWLGRIGVLDRAPATAFAHAIFASEEDLRLLARPQHHLVWCPFSALVFGYPAPVGRWHEAGVRWAVATDCASNNDSMNVQQELRMVAAQRTVGTTDSSQARAVHEHGTLAAVERAWADRSDRHRRHSTIAEPETMFSSVWSTPGEIHPGVRAGVIEAGALANLCVFDLEHPALWPAIEPLRALSMADACQAIWAMYCHGRLVSTPGDHHRSLVRSDAYRMAREEASERLARIVE